MLELIRPLKYSVYTYRYTGLYTECLGRLRGSGAAKTQKLFHSRAFFRPNGVYNSKVGQKNPGYVNFFTYSFKISDFQIPFSKVYVRACY